MSKQRYRKMQRHSVKAKGRRFCGNSSLIYNQCYITSQKKVECYIKNKRYPPAVSSGLMFLLHTVLPSKKTYNATASQRSWDLPAYVCMTFIIKLSGDNTLCFSCKKASVVQKVNNLVGLFEFLANENGNCLCVL